MVTSPPPPSHLLLTQLANFPEIGANLDWLPEEPPIEPFFWQQLLEHYKYFDWDFDCADYTDLWNAEHFVNLLAEFGVDLAWTNSEGENIVQFTQNHPEAFGELWVNSLPMLLRRLQSALELSKVNRAKGIRPQQEVKEEGKEAKEKEKES